MCGVAGFKGGVTFLAFAAGTRGERSPPALHSKRLRAGTPTARASASLKIHKNTQCKNATRISAPPLPERLPPQDISLGLLIGLLCFKPIAEEPAIHAPMQICTTRP
jgi:hypothetical protein